MLHKSVEWEPSWYIWTKRERETNGQRDMTKLSVAICNLYECTQNLFHSSYQLGECDGNIYKFQNVMNTCCQYMVYLDIKQ